MKHQSLLLVLLLSTSLCYGEPAKEYWTTEMGNSAHTGYVNVTVNPTQLTLVWKKQFGEPVGGRRAPSITNPVITDKALYIFDSSTDDKTPSKLEALDPATGDFIWRQDVKSMQFDHARLFNLTLYQNKLYAIEDESTEEPKFKNDVKIQAYNADNGAQIFSVLSNYSTGAWYTTPTVIDNIVYVGSIQRQLALNANDGSQQWSVDTLTDSEMSTSAAAGDFLLRNKNDGLYVVNRATGAIDTTIIAASDTTDDMYNIPAWDEASRTAISVITLNTHNTCNGCWITTQLTAYDVDQKTVKWKQILPAVEQPVFSDNEIYYSSDKTLYAANIVTGNVDWTWSEPAHVEHLLLTANLIFASSDEAKTTYAISRKTHEVVWQTNEFGELTIDNKRLYIKNYGSSFFPHLSVYSFESK